MRKKRIFVLGTALLIGFILTSCAGYYAGYGYYDYPYYNYDYGYYPYRHHREFGVSPNWGEHRGSGEHHGEGEHHSH